MVHMEPVPLSRSAAVGIEVSLPRTHLAIVATDVGYIMCGALDVRLLDTRLAARAIVAARALGVRDIAGLLEAPIDDLTEGAAALGIYRGMRGRDALERMQQPVEEGRDVPEANPSPHA